MNNVCLLTLPGWSNVDSWLVPIRDAKTKANFQLYVVSPSPWVLSKLSRDDELGNRLNALDPIFLIHTSTGLNVRATNYQDARMLSLFILVLEKFRAMRVPKILETVLFLSRRLRLLRGFAVVHGHGPEFQIVCSDVDVLSSNLSHKDELFLLSLTNSSFFSLWHGTAQLSSEQKKVLSHRMQPFSHVTIFSTGPSQTEKYAKFFENFHVNISEVVSPRLAELSKFREQGPADSEKRTGEILFLNRDPRTIFPKRPIFFSTLGLVRLARAASKNGVKNFLIKLHPNQSRLISIIQLFFVRLCVLPSQLTVTVTKKHAMSLTKTKAAFTWFSGVAVDLLCSGVPVYELRSSDNKLGPNISTDAHWNFLLNSQLTRRIKSKEEIEETLRTPSSMNEQTLRTFDLNFRKHFFSSETYNSVSAHLVKILSKPDKPKAP